MWFRFKKKVLFKYPKIKKSDIKEFWDDFYYSSVFSGQKRKSKTPIKYQSYVISNKPLSEFQVDLLTPPEYLKKDNNYKLILLVADVVRNTIFFINYIVVKSTYFHISQNFIKMVV